VRFWKLQKHVTEVHDPIYHLIETKNQDTWPKMVFLKKIVTKGFSISFISFSSQIVGDMFPIIS
jgi:hypothetical protein